MMHDWGKARQEKLLKKAQQGDADAFEQLVAPYEQKIYALCLRLLAHREDAQDAAQETMLRLYRALVSYRGEAQLGTFIYRRRPGGRFARPGGDDPARGGKRAPFPRHRCAQRRNAPAAGAA